MVDALAALSLVMGFTFPFWDFAFNARKKDECPPLEMSTKVPFIFLKHYKCIFIYKTLYIVGPYFSFLKTNYKASAPAPTVHTC